MQHLIYELKVVDILLELLPSCLTKKVVLGRLLAPWLIVHKQGLLSHKRCKTETQLQQKTNRKSYLVY